MIKPWPEFLPSRMAGWFVSSGFWELCLTTDELHIRIYEPGRFSHRWRAQITRSRPTRIFWAGFSSEAQNAMVRTLADHPLLGKDCEQWEAAEKACLDVLVKLSWGEPGL